MRASWPIASASRVTSAPVTSAISAMALMNEIFVARKAFAATFTSSAVGKFVTMRGVPEAIAEAYTSSSTAVSRSSSTP